MGVYTGNDAGITPVTTDDNFSLDAGAGESGQILEVGWGGEATASTAMRTRLARSGGSPATPVVGTAGKRRPNSVANIIIFTTGWTTQPTIDAVPQDLIPVQSWNAHGGVVRWLAAPGEEIIMIGAEIICCRNAVGVGVSSYGATWQED